MSDPLHVVGLCVLVLSCGCQPATVPPAYRTVPLSSVDRSNQAKEANAAGLACVQQGDLAGAEGHFRRALVLAPSYAAAHNNLGLALLRRQAFYEAALEFQFAAELAPTAPEPVGNLGRLYEAVGWHEDAIAEYERVLSLAPDSTQTITRLIELCRRSGTHTQRVEELLVALSHHHNYLPKLASEPSGSLLTLERAP